VRLLGLPLLLVAAQGPFPGPPAPGGGYTYISPQFIPASPVWTANDHSRLSPGLFGLESLGGEDPSSSSHSLALPPFNINTASNAIFPLTDISAEPTQVAKNGEQAIGVYQGTLTKMYLEVTGQKESIEKSEELIEKLKQVQASNKRILIKNMETVKKYSEGLINIVTQYTESLDMGKEGGKGEGKEGGEGKEEHHGKGGHGEGGGEGGEHGEHGAGEGGEHKEQGHGEGEQGHHSFMEKLAQLKEHAALGLRF